MDGDDFKFYLKELRSNECRCGRNKQPGKSFCFNCYKRLPWDMQRALYRYLHEGYPQAYDEAAAFLEDEDETTGTVLFQG